MGPLMEFLPLLSESLRGPGEPGASWRSAPLLLTGDRGSVKLRYEADGGMDVGAVEAVGFPAAVESWLFILSDLLDSWV